MKRIDKLLKLARKRYEVEDLEPDGFIEALGLDPEAYKLGKRDNFLQALADTALADWGSYEGI